SRRGSCWRGRDPRASSTDDSWYLEETGGDIAVGSGRERLVSRQRRLRRVVAPRGGHTERMRRRWHASGRDLLHLFGVREDAGQLGREQRLLVFGQLEPREARDALDIFARESTRHARDPSMELA